MTDLKKNCSDSLFHLAAYTFRNKVFNPDEFAKRFPIPSSNVKVIFYLSNNGPAAISKVAKDLDISRPNMTPIIDKLIAEGFAKRYNDPNDRRVIKVEITEKANELFRKSAKTIKEIISDKLSFYTEDDLKELDSLCKKIAIMLDRLD